MLPCFSRLGPGNIILKFGIRCHVPCCNDTDVTIETGPQNLTVLQAFISYNFSCPIFCAHKTILGAHPCMSEIVHLKEAKNGLSISAVCIAPFL